MPIGSLWTLGSSIREASIKVKNSNKALNGRRNKDSADQHIEFDICTHAHTNTRTRRCAHGSAQGGRRINTHVHTYGRVPIRTRNTPISASNVHPCCLLDTQTRGTSFKEKFNDHSYSSTSNLNLMSVRLR